MARPLCSSSSSSTTSSSYTSFPPFSSDQSFFNFYSFSFFGIPRARRRPEMEFSGCKEIMWGAKLRRRRRRRRLRRRETSSGVRRKVEELQRLVPGGRRLQPDRLFLRTADYILHLRLQVDLLQALSKIYIP